MSPNYRQLCTAETDLFESAKEIYKGRQYQDPSTHDIYEFDSFLLFSAKNRVQVKNITKGAFELLTRNKWYSFLSVPESRLKKSPAPRLRSTEEIPSEVPSTYVPRYHCKSHGTLLTMDHVRNYCLSYNPDNKCTGNSWCSVWLEHNSEKERKKAREKTLAEIRRRIPLDERSP